MSILDDPRVTGGADGHGYTVTTDAGAGRVTPNGDGTWTSAWVEGHPMPHVHDTAEEAVDSFTGSEDILRRINGRKVTS